VSEAVWVIALRGSDRTAASTGFRPGAYGGGLDRGECRVQDVRAFREAVPVGVALSFPARRRRVARELGSHHEADRR
jgi:hypothetical protein